MVGCCVAMETLIWIIIDTFTFDCKKNEFLLFRLCKYCSYIHLLKKDNILLNVVLYMKADRLTIRLP